MRSFTLLLAALPILAQAPAFEVASVKPSPPMGAKPSIVRDPGGGFTAANIDIQTLILLAYRVQEYQLKGAPGWIRSDRFDVVAKAPASAKKDQTWAMLQTLLADRLQLTVHHETADMPVYLLTVAKSGLRIRPADRPRAEIDGFFQTNRGRVKLSMAPLDQLAFALSDVVGRRVLDRTGTRENFDLQLEWSPETTGPAATGPTLAAALREQLGLTLEASRAPVDTLVIDRVEKPSAN